MIRLALANIRFRMTRTTMTVFAMAIAAAVATSGMSLSGGIARMADVEYRNYYGGDIVVYTPSYVGANPIYDTGSTVSRAMLYDSGFNMLARLYPQFITEGYLQYDKYPYVPLSAEAQLMLANHPRTSQLKPVHVLPAVVEGRDTTLRVITEQVQFHLSSGRMPVNTNEGPTEVVLNAYGGPQAKLGDLITVDIPMFRLGASGVPYADHSVYASIPARVVGIVQWPTRELMYTPPGASVTPIYEQGYVHIAEAYISPEKWQRIWNEQSSGANYPVLAATLKVNNLSELNVAAAELRSMFPELTIKTVPEVARHVERHNLLDHFYRIPKTVWVNELATLSQDYMPLEMGFLSSILLFANAGMLLAGQMLAGVTERKKEIGVLKALGARQREIVGMVLVEGILLAISGSLIGFSVVRLLGVHRDISNALGWAAILRTTVVEMGLVVSLTTAVAVFFSAIPAARMARLSVMEVFRNE